MKSIVIFIIGLMCAVAFINCDVNDLKIVNDSCNHDTGSEYLKNAGSMLDSSVREISSILSVEAHTARDHGDEFSITLSGNVNLNKPLTSEMKDQLKKDPMATKISTEMEGANVLEIITRYTSIGTRTNHFAICSRHTRLNIPRFPRGVGLLQDVGIDQRQ